MLTFVLIEEDSVDVFGGVGHDRGLRGLRVEGHL